MRILIAPDKFKDALTAMEAAKAIEEGIKSALPDSKTTLLPLADGGEGTAELLTSICGGSLQKTPALNPIMEPVNCSWGYLAKDKKSFIELAEASGLRLLPEWQRNPIHTTTYGTGQLINAALAKGARNFVIGLGGSATNDGGTGMAAALGYRFLDTDGKEISHPTGNDLIRIRKIVTNGVHPLLSAPDFKAKAACDVTNPLLGPSGATYTYARQKGAKEYMLPLLEDGMKNLAEIIENDLGIKVKEQPGSGAAGGAGAGVIAFLKGELCSGAELILEYSKFREKLKGADLLITGEGKIDATSLQGKLIGKLCDLAREASVPVVAFCGSSEISIDQIDEKQLKNIISISSNEKNLQDALNNTYKNLKAAALHFIQGYNG